MNLPAIPMMHIKKNQNTAAASSMQPVWKAFAKTLLFSTKDKGPFYTRLGNQ